MTLDEFMSQTPEYHGREDELELWAQRSFKQQMQDVYGEAYRLVKYSQEGSSKLSAQWDVFDGFCAMTYLSPNITKGEKDTLRLAEWELYDYVFGDNTFKNDSASVMRWFNQWMFNVNYAALAEG